MTDTRNPVVWVCALLTVLGIFGMAPLMAGAFAASPMGTAFAIVVWLLYAWALWAIVRRIFRGERMPRGASLAAVVWGGVISAGMGYWVTPAVGDLVASVVEDDEWAGAIAAGISEEPLKLIGVFALAMIPATRMTRTLDFVYYGLLVGLGFEVTESILYSADAAGGGDPFLLVIATLVLRGIIGGLWSHPTYSAIAAGGLGYLLTSSASAVRRWAVFIVALAAAMALHAFFDSPVLEGNVVVASVVKGLPALVVLVVVAMLARRHARSQASPDAAGVPEPTAP